MLSIDGATTINHNLNDNHNHYSNDVHIRGDAESSETFKTMQSLGNIDIVFNTIDSDSTKPLIYGRDTHLDRVVSNATEFYWHNELYRNTMDIWLIIITIIINPFNTHNNGDCCHV